jgi:regulator of protease activity HflC (stomatin/prohibitin superfamily)
VILNLFINLIGLLILILSIVFGFVLPIARASAEISRSRYGDKDDKAVTSVPKRHIFRAVIGIIVGFAILIIGLSGPFVEVPAGNVGVLTNFGQVQEGTLQPGLHVIIPIVQQVVNVDTRVQPHNFQQIDAATKENLSVQVTGTMNYHVDPQYASVLYQNVGTDFASKVIDPAFSDYIKQVTPNYSADSGAPNFILNKRDEIRQLTKNQLGENLARYHIIVDDIYIVDISYPAAFNDAITAKQVATQQVQTEQQILLQKQIQAQQVNATAKGAADATVTLATGQAQANALLNASLTDKILEYQYINKLANNISVMLLPSGNGTIFDLKSLLGQGASTTPSPSPSAAP